MLFKSSGVAVLVVVALTGIVAASTDYYHSDELKEAFKRLENYLEVKVGEDGHNSAYLKAAKKAQWKLELGSYLPRAAKIYVYLNEFETCSPTAIDYIRHVLYGRPNAQPGHQEFSRLSRGPKPKTPFDRLLESSIVRASNKCKSFLEQWYRKSEAKIDPHSREVLHNLISRQIISERRVGSFGTDFANKTLSDPSLRAKLLQMDDEQLMKFYTTYLDENFLEPCKSFLANMRPVMESAERFHPRLTYSDLFDKWSQEFQDDFVRFRECSFNTGVRNGFLDTHARIAIKSVKKEKNLDVWLNRDTDKNSTN